MNNNKLLIGSFYRADLSNQYWELIDDAFGKALDFNPKAGKTGDFNYNILNTTNIAEQIQLLYDLEQVITEPATLTATTRTLIDLIFLSFHDPMNKSGVLTPVCSDHCPVFTCITFCKHKKQAYKRTIYDYSYADY